MKYSIHETIEQSYFKYGIEVFGMLNFHRVRQWFNKTYGFSTNVDYNQPISNEHWAYHIVYKTYVFYVQGDEELAWFKLKYGQEELI